MISLPHTLGHPASIDILHWHFPCQSSMVRACERNTLILRDFCVIGYARFTRDFLCLQQRLAGRNAGKPCPDSWHPLSATAYTAIGIRAASHLSDPDGEETTRSAKFVWASALVQRPIFPALGIASSFTSRCSLPSRWHWM